jgi:hypothetical protein
MRKLSTALRFLVGLALAVILLGLVVLRVTNRAPAPLPAPPVAAAPPSPADCAAGPAAAARANAASLSTLAWAPFRHRPETGWETYAPLIAREIGTACPPGSAGFAARLAAWQQAHGLSPDGVMSPAVFDRLSGLVELRRPFVRLNATGVCPAPPPEDALATAAPAESYGGMTIRLRPAALAAYRRMVAAARAEAPGLAADPQLLTLFSGYRGPAQEVARCARGGCGGPAKASCSAHRTGLAVDIYLGAAPGSRIDSSDDANRLYLSRTPAYRWLVRNADRFGFVNYPFEPWHWEWTGEPP